MINVCEAADCITMPTVKQGDNESGVKASGESRMRKGSLKTDGTVAITNDRGGMRRWKGTTQFSQKTNTLETTHGQNSPVADENDVSSGANKFKMGKVGSGFHVITSEGEFSMTQVSEMNGVKWPQTRPNFCALQGEHTQSIRAAIKFLGTCDPRTGGFHQQIIFFLFLCSPRSLE